MTDVIPRLSRKRPVCTVNVWTLARSVDGGYLLFAQGHNQLRFKFPTKHAAVAFAELHRAPYAPDVAKWILKWEQDDLAKAAQAAIEAMRRPEAVQALVANAAVLSEEAP